MEGYKGRETVFSLHGDGSGDTAARDVTTSSRPADDDKAGG